MRINERLLAYWQSLRTSASLPTEAQIDPEQLKDIWDHCFLLHAEPEHRYTYTMLGHALVEAYGDDWTGKSVCEALLYPHPEPLFAAFKEVVATAEPHNEENSFTNAAGLLIKYRSCLVPLARHEGGPVAYILGGMKWKAY
jgi:hypothetical protein